MEKDSKQWVEEAMDDMSAEIASIEKQNETTNLQIAESRKRIGKLREKIEILKVEVCFIGLIYLFRLERGSRTGRISASKAREGFWYDQGGKSQA